MNELDQHIEAVRRGDMGRFQAVVEACEPRVRAVIAAMIPDPALVPDLTQDVFVIAYRKLGSYTPGTNFHAWIRTIARNVAQNERRRWYRRHAMKEDLQADAERRLAENIDRFVKDLPEDTLAALQDCVGGLGGRTRELVDGFYYDRCSIKELAGLLKLSANAVKVALHRAREALGQCMETKGTTP